MADKETTVEVIGHLVWALTADDIALAVTAKAEGAAPSWHTVCAIGKTAKPAIGKALDITRALAEEWIAAFKRRGKPASFDLHHATLMAAKTGDPRWLDPALSSSRGQYLDLRLVDDEIQALIDWTKDGAQLVKEKAFRFFSVEIGKPSDTGEQTITGGTLTNNPAADVPAIAFTEAAFEYLDAEAGGATTEPTKYPSAESNPEVMEEPMTTETTGLAALLGVAEDEVEAKVKALHDDAETVTALAAELAEKEARMADLADADFDRELADRVFADGRMKNDDTAKAALRTVYDADRDGFIALCAAMVPGTVPVRKAEGADAEEPEDKDEPKALTAEAAGNELHALATTLTTDDTDYSAAYALACEQKPELLTAYEAGDGRDI